MHLCVGVQCDARHKPTGERRSTVVRRSRWTNTHTELRPRVRTATTYELVDYRILSSTGVQVSRINFPHPCTRNTYFFILFKHYSHLLVCTFYAIDMYVKGEKTSARRTEISKYSSNKTDLINRHCKTIFYRIIFICSCVIYIYIYILCNFLMHPLVYY
jgi:hypothetical protein